MDHESMHDKQRISGTVGAVDTANLGAGENSKNLGDGDEIVGSVDSVNSGTSENSRDLVDGGVSGTVIVAKLDEEDVSYGGRENRDLNVEENVPGSSKVSVEEERKVKDLEEEKHSCVIDVKCGGGVLAENLYVKANVPESSKILVDEPKVKDSEEEKHSCIINVKCGGGGLGESLDGERVCRICHLNADQSSECTNTASVTVILIHLGCSCKDELGIAHAHCADAWFTLKGNRMCEICGETAKNVTAVGDNRFIEEWNERSTISGSNASERSGGCWRGQPFCNFLMACLVIAFVLPWFFRVNMF